MKGLELSEKFYKEYGEPMLREKFPDVYEKLAVGLVGSGSECFGYDDLISTDHDFEPGFCIFLPDDIDRRTEFLLEREYSRLPKEFMGYRRSTLSPFGGNRHGVIRMSDFFLGKTGSVDGRLTLEQWFSIPDQALLEAVNGKVFYDKTGRFTSVRERLSYFPRDVRLKKLAGEILLMGQAGKYNYFRCVERGDTAAAQLSAYEFVSHAIAAVFLINGKYMPYYKWRFRAFSELDLLSELKEPFEFIISSGNKSEDFVLKEKMINEICDKIFDLLVKNGFSDYKGDTAEGHTDSINGKINDTDVRNLHVLYGV